MQSIFELLASVRDIFNAHLVFGLGVLLSGSYFMGRLAEKLGIPAITGFIVAGLLLGPSCLGLVHVAHRESLASITEIALAIIALVIGSEFNLRKLRKVGRSVVLITLVQLFATMIVVCLALVAVGMSFPAAAIMGAIASATAPAATVAVVRNLKARGPFIDHLYGVVALDDAGCVLLFSAVFAIAGSALGQVSISLSTTILHAFSEIIFSIALGIGAGILLHLLTKKLGRDNEMFIISLGIVCILTAMATSLSLSPLLASMAVGTTMANLSRKSYRILSLLENLSPPLYAAFFAIAGTELSLKTFSSGHALLLGAVFVLARAVGKYGGVFLGATAARSGPLVRNYLGFAMLPQAGVAIGLVLFLQAAPYFQQAPETVRQVSDVMVNMVLFSVLINELVGPPVSKFAVVRGATL